jgi:uncharacterized membrane protein YedE/YeeE
VTPIHRHWSWLPSGLVLSVILIAFWFVNRDYLTRGPGPGAFFLENPLPAFGLMIFGAFLAASAAGEFAIKAPLTVEPIIFALLGGVVAGVGSVIAGMSVYSVVLFNLAGVFTLPAFMITKGWVYLAFMIGGGAVGSRLLLLTTLKLGRATREISVPKSLNERKSRLVYFGLAVVFVVVMTVVFVLLVPPAQRAPAVLSMGLMVLLGLAAERGTICMSSMLKELFISHSAYVWRSVLFTIMCLALLYQLGLQLRLYGPIEAGNFVTAPALLAIGSFFMGLGFVFADGCFIGSLWKTGQGNVVNVAGLVGLVVGIGAMQMLERFIPLPVSASPIPNRLASVADSWLLVAVLWALGLAALFLFRRKRYRY